MKRGAFILLGALLASTPGRGEEPACRDVSAVVAAVREKHRLPAMAGAIVSGGRLAAAGVDGVRRRGSPEKATLDDRWHLGSCTKAMTATLCAALIEEGKLAWTTKPAEVLSDVTIDETWRGATLELFLHNRGGAPADLAAGGLWAALCAHEGTPTQARRTLVESVLGRPPMNKPGTRFLYSNAGFAIAGAMAETVAKKPWEDLMRERIFVPLDMASAGFGAPGTAASVDQPRGHDDGGKPVEPGPGSDNPAAIGPAGTVHCTIGDWAKFVALHVEGERKDRARLLQPETFVKLHAAKGAGEEAKYAAGWIVTERTWAGGRTLTHAGSNNLWFCVAWLAPERDFAVLVTCNQGGDAAMKACDEAAWALIQDHAAHAAEKK